mmetsp:Transcript_7564/g.26967  ORF Transcript_7564/g.26967 Transcript_7564/m.26967 type:complete len:212 (-) Transcript_7564:365-1000(-)
MIRASPLAAAPALAASDVAPAAPVPTSVVTSTSTGFSSSTATSSRTSPSRKLSTRRSATRACAPMASVTLSCCSGNRSTLKKARAVNAVLAVSTLPAATYAEKVATTPMTGNTIIQQMMHAHTPSSFRIHLSSIARSARMRAVKDSVHANSFTMRMACSTSVHSRTRSSATAMCFCRMLCSVLASHVENGPRITSAAMPAAAAGPSRSTRK